MQENQITSLEIGIGGGHNLFMQIGEASLPGCSGRFIVGRDGTLSERLKVLAAGMMYKEAGKSLAQLTAYRVTRMVLNGRADLIPQSRSNLLLSPGICISYHSMAVPGRERDIVVLGDAMAEKPVCKEPLIFAATNEVVTLLQKCGYRASLGGWPTHPMLIDEKTVDERKKRIQRGEKLKILIALSGQTPYSHRNLILRDASNIANLIREEKADFVIYTTTNTSFAKKLEQVFDQNGVSPKIVFGNNFDDSNLAFVQEASLCDLLFTMPCERMGLLQLIPTAFFPAVNNNSAADQQFAESKSLAIPACEVARLNISGVVCQIYKNRGQQVLANMDRAAKNMDINFGKRLRDEVEQRLWNI